MNKIIITAVFAFQAVISAGAADRSVYLDTSYANENYYLTDEQKARRCPAAEQFFDTAYAFYKQKNDREAVKWYELSLQKYSSPKIYYNYANSLSNIGEYANAVKGYEVSIAMNFNRPDLAHYNMACAYSLMRNSGKAYEHLKLAVLNGYPRISYLKTDSDFSFLRKGSVFNQKYNELKILYDRGNLDFVKGRKLVHEVASSEDVYTFNSDGTVELKYMVSEDRNYKKAGRYNVKNYIVYIDWLYESGEKGVGEPESCASTCTYSEYQPYKKKITGEELLRWTVINSKDDGVWTFK